MKLPLTSGDAGDHYREAIYHLPPLGETLRFRSLLLFILQEHKLIQET